MTLKLRLLLVCILLAISGIYIYLSTYGGGYLRDIIETEGSRITQSVITVGSVSMDLSSGYIELDKVEISNPVGFRYGLPGIVFRAVAVNFDPASLKGDGAIVIKNLYFYEPQVNYSVGAGSVDNLSKLHTTITSHKLQQNTMYASVRRDLTINSITLGHGKLHIMKGFGVKEETVPIPGKFIDNAGVMKNLAPNDFCALVVSVIRESVSEIMAARSPDAAAAKKQPDAAKTPPAPPPPKANGK